MSENDKLTGHIIGHAMRFIRNDGDGIETVCEVERSDDSPEEIELAFMLARDRYYLRLRKDDLRRLLDAEATP